MKGLWDFSAGEITRRMRQKGMWVKDCCVSAFVGLLDNGLVVSSEMMRVGHSFG